MNNHSDIVGKLAQLHGLVNKIELNGAYVLIQAYLYDKNRFSVKPLPSPNGIDNTAEIAVKFESIKLCSQHNFHDRNADPMIMQVISLNATACELPDGSVLDLKTLQHTPGKHLNIVFLNSHRIIGTKMTLNSCGVPQPQTKFFGDIHVAPHSEDTIIEFEDICFVGIQGRATNLASCTVGQKTTFRRCSFHNITMIVAGDDILTRGPVTRAYLEQDVVKRLGRPHVVFESCLFDGESYTASTCGLAVGNDGTVTAFNCVFRNYCLGVSVNEGGKANLMHCSSEYCDYGMAANDKVSGLDLLNCSATNCEKKGFLLDAVGPIVVKGCKVENCKEVGIFARGRSKHLCRLQIDECHISKCGDGIEIDMGEYAARISSCTIERNERFGLLTPPGVIGRVDFTQCTILHNRVSNIVNLSHTEGVLTVDGASVIAIPNIYEPPESLFARRNCQRAGLCDIYCQKCGRKEEKEEKFKKCGKCENVCYCSKECQKAHWKEHKI